MYARTDVAGFCEKRLRQGGLKYLFHWTHFDNLPGIASQGAVLSKAELQRRGLWPCARPGGNELSHELDQRFGTWEFVSTAPATRTPMLSRRVNDGWPVCLLALDLQIADRPGVEFTDRNAASARCRRAPAPEGLDLLDFDALRRPPEPQTIFWMQKILPRMQAEVLIPLQIERRYIREIIVSNRESVVEVRKRWQDGGPVIRLAPDLFPRRKN